MELGEEGRGGGEWGNSFDLYRKQGRDRQEILFGFCVPAFDENSEFDLRVGAHFEAARGAEAHKAESARRLPELRDALVDAEL